MASVRRRQRRTSRDPRRRGRSLRAVARRALRRNAIPDTCRRGMRLSALPAGSRLHDGWHVHLGARRRIRRNVRPGLRALGRRSRGRATRRAHHPRAEGQRARRHAGRNRHAARARRDVQQPFLLAGWAADLDASAGTGIDTLHVWAFPLAGGADLPRRAGLRRHPSRRGRPCTAIASATRASASTVQGLPAGTYDLQVFPWSNVTGGFAPPSVVRVTVK